MNDAQPHSYSLAKRVTRKGGHHTLGLWLVIGASLVMIGGELSGEAWSGVACSIYVSVIATAGSLCRSTSSLACSRCGSEITREPLVCNKCRCKCLPDEAPLAASPSWAPLDMIALGLASLVFLVEAWLLFRA